MGFSTSKFQYAHGLRESLKNIPYRPPNDIDFAFLSENTGLSKKRARDILEDHLKVYDNGTVNKKEFCYLFSLLQNVPPEKVSQYCDNVFKALGVPDEGFISLNEFLITFALFTKADPQRKLEYAFSIYDIDHTNSLDPNEVREIIYGILEIFNPNLENINDVSKEIFDSIRLSDVVKKEDFINGLIDNKSITSVLSPQPK